MYIIKLWFVLYPLDKYGIKWYLFCIRVNLRYTGVIPFKGIHIVDHTKIRLLFLSGNSTFPLRKHLLFSKNICKRFSRGIQY